MIGDGGKAEEGRAWACAKKEETVLLVRQEWARENAHLSVYLMPRPSSPTRPAHLPPTVLPAARL